LTSVARSGAIQFFRTFGRVVEKLSGLQLITKSTKMTKLAHHNTNHQSIANSNNNTITSATTTMNRNHQNNPSTSSQNSVNFTKNKESTSQQVEITNGNISICLNI
jgi:hypothetical protein